MPEPTYDSMDGINHGNGEQCRQELQAQKQLFGDNIEARKWASNAAINGPYLEIKKCNDWRNKRNYMKGCLRGLDHQYFSNLIKVEDGLEISSIVFFIVCFMWRCLSLAAVGFLSKPQALPKQPREDRWLENEVESQHYYVDLLEVALVVMSGRAQQKSHIEALPLRWDT